MNLAKLTRAHEWWDFKTPQVLSLAYAAAIACNSLLFNLLFPAFFIIFTSLVVIAIYASIINDFTDLSIDTACGKANMMQNISIWMRMVLLITSIVLLAIAVYFIYPFRSACIFYLGICISISIYSFEPIRLKKRGLWGVIACAMAEHFFPTLFAMSIIFYFANSKIDIFLLAIAGTISLCWGLRSILYHQFKDRENDKNSGIDTFANRINPNTFKFVPRLLVFTELFALTVLLISLKLWIVLIAFLVYLLFTFLKQYLFKSKIIIVISPKSGFYQIFMLEFYALFFPVALLIYVSAAQANGYIVLILHLILFHKLFLTTLKELFDLSKVVINKLIRVAKIH
ncbi:UbiA family prenyltransferase [Pedobacter mendelii]|uniref:UbiA family prenyltransferase n=1 Tax=Pedobacter mendelii TaxID=1908240 RepID=UPI00166E1056|nr:UbiA family prenyltransferase [Pedobacter mendelii]